MRQQFSDPADRLRWEPLQHIAQVGVGIKPLSLAEWTRLITAAALLPARKLLAKSQFCLPSAMGRMRFSTQFLSMGRSPSSR